MNTKLMEEGRNHFDMLQKNLTDIITSTDEQLTEKVAQRNELASMFGGQVYLDAEGLRDESRKTQDALDRQGRESFAAEYAANQVKNITG